MEKITFEESKNYQLGILSSIDAFCRTHNINYSIAYGTLLGAVRHNGFIPWDDDIDIVMLRKDYDLFVSTYTDAHYKLLKGEEIANHLHVVVTDPSTVVRFEKGTTDDKFYKGGVWVDIFPLDYVPNDNLEFERQKKSIARKRLLQRYGEIIPLNKSDNVVKKFLKVIVHYALSLTKERNGAKALNLMRKYNSEDTGMVANLSVWYLKHNQFIPSAWFESFVELDFEGHCFFAVSNYEDYLISLYGDWKKLPPQSEQIPKHHYTAYKKE